MHSITSPQAQLPTIQPVDEAVRYAMPRFHGLAGGNYYNDTSNHSGDWCALKAIGGDAVFTAIKTNIQSLPNNLTITEDDVLFCRVESFTLASGAVIAYNTNIANF